MSKSQDSLRMARVNLLEPRRPPWHSQRFKVDWRSIGLVGVALVSWTVAGVGVALMLGWHPQLFSGP
jgi:hypothetical protein